MDDLLQRINKALPSSVRPDVAADMVHDIALLVIEGRIDVNDLKSGIQAFSKLLRKRYRDEVGWNAVSLSQPICSDSAITIADTITTPAIGKSHRCLWCRRRVKPGASFCGSGCVLKNAQRRRRKVDPEELKRLHSERWLSRADSAKALGVTKNAINSVVYRHKLSRLNPAVCRSPGCNKPCVRFRHMRGYETGTLCLEHKREVGRLYQQRCRDRNRVKLTSDQRKEHARKASLARWDKHRRAMQTGGSIEA